MSKFLYRLIHDLTSREKAYFKRFSKIHGDSNQKNYLFLFDLLVKEEAYEEEKIKAGLGKNKIATNLTSELSYLQSNLLRCLANFHLENSNEMKLQKFILYIELLTGKGFSKQALRMIKKAKKLAQQNEDFSNILKLIQLEENLLFEEGITGFTRNLEALQEERDIISSKIKNLNQLRLLREQVRELHLKEFYIQNPEDYPKFYENELLNTPEYALSVRATEHWFYTKGMSAYILRNFEESKYYYEKMLEHVEKHQGIFKLSHLLAPLGNYLFSCCLLRDKEAFYKAFSKLNEFENEPSINSEFVIYIRYARELEMQYFCGVKEKDVGIMLEAFSFIKVYGPQLEESPYSNLNLILVRGFLLKKKFEMALDLLNEGLKRGYMDLLILRSRLYLLMVYYELDWTEMVASEVEATYKLFKRNNCLNDLSRAMIKFFKGSVRTPHRMNFHCEKLIGTLNEIKDIPQFIYEFESFNYLEWAEAKKKLL